MTWQIQVGHVDEPASGMRILKTLPAILCEAQLYPGEIFAHTPYGRSDDHMVDGSRFSTGLGSGLKIFMRAPRLHIQIEPMGSTCPS